MKDEWDIWDSRQYTKKQRIAVSKIVITHWMENLLLAYADELHVEDVYGSKCKFCNLFHSTPSISDSLCKYCPLNIWSYNCNDYHSEWDTVYEELKNQEFHKELHTARIVRYVKDMLEKLEWVCDAWVNSPIKETK